jgi:phenylacetate-CoA ligase
MLDFGGTTYQVTSSDVDFDEHNETYDATLLSFANDTLETCPFYADRATRNGFIGRKLHTAEDFSRLPLLHSMELRSISPLDLLSRQMRSQLESNGPAGLVGDDRIVRIAQSTSSSGAAPKVAFYTRADWRASAALWERLRAAMTAEKSLRVLNCFHPGHGMGRFLDEVVGSSGAIVVNRHHASTSTAEDIEQLRTELAEFGGFNCLAAPGCSPNPRAKGASLDLLLTADADNVIGRNIRLVITAGAPLDDPRAKIRERLLEASQFAGTQPPAIRELYGGSEVGIAAGSCEQGKLHFFPGPVFGEVVDADTGLPTPSGQVGRVAVTSLRHGSRYVRYLIGDEATVRRERCDCGRRTARLENISRVVEPERLQSGCAAGGRQ